MADLFLVAAFAFGFAVLVGAAWATRRGRRVLLWVGDVLLTLRGFLSSW